MTTRRFPLSFSRMMVAGFGALALAILPAGCIAGAAGDESAPSAEGPAREPQMAGSCEDPTYNCCLNYCGEALYDCNRDCRSDDTPDRGACFSGCQSTYSSCLQSCDTIWLHIPPW